MIGEAVFVPVVGVRVTENYKSTWGGRIAWAKGDTEDRGEEDGKEGELRRGEHGLMRAVMAVMAVVVLKGDNRSQEASADVYMHLGRARSGTSSSTIPLCRTLQLEVLAQTCPN